MSSGFSPDVPATRALSPAAQRLVDALEATISDAAWQIAEQIWAEVPAYKQITDPGIFEEVQDVVAAVLKALVRSLRGRKLTYEDLTFVRAPITRQARRNVKLHDYVHGHRVGQRLIWATILAAARDSESREAALTLVDPMLDFINALSTHFAEVYAELQQLRLAEGDSVRRDLLRDLLAGREPQRGARQDALHAAGLATGGTLIVISARPMVSGYDAHTLWAGATALGRVGTTTLTPLAVLRDDEIIAIVPAEHARVRQVADALRTARDWLARQRLPLAIGASTVVAGLPDVPVAYREACDARAHSHAATPVVCLCELNAFEYLALIANETAARLIAPAVATFVAEDLAHGGVLTTTLVEYAACDLNVKAAAERLHVHVNTAHYRLARIAERADRDLRNLNHINELLIAIELARGPRRRDA